LFDALNYWYLIPNIFLQCYRALGLDLLPATLTLPLLKGELCQLTTTTTTSSVSSSSSSSSSEGIGAEEVEDHLLDDFQTTKRAPIYSSCSLIRPLRILILHNHCPLFTRWGGLTYNKIYSIDILYYFEMTPLMY